MKKIDGKNVVGFEWDKGNKDKNWKKHKVSSNEAEEVFMNKPIHVTYDKEHSQKEDRYSILGITNNKRLLSIFFTIRNNKVRVISARNQDRKERRKYEKTQKNSKI